MITIELKLKLSEDSKITQNCPHVYEINNTLLKKPFEEEKERNDKVFQTEWKLKRINFWDVVKAGKVNGKVNHLN